MARVTAKELAQRIVEKMGNAEGVESILEDVADSVGDIDMSQYVAKSDYEKMAADASNAQNALSDMREKYINRFYQGYSNPNETGYIMGQATQAEIQGEEKKRWYDTLFE